jgi:hypothetical protein
VIGLVNHSATVFVLIKVLILYIITFATRLAEW